MTVFFQSQIVRAAVWGVIGALGVCASAQAQSAGSWSVRAGVIVVTPQVSSGDLSPPSPPGTRINVDAATSLGAGVGYMFTDHWAIDVPLALPFKHKIKGDGAIAGSGEIGSVEVVPVTVMGQYHFGSATAEWRPYLGAGLTYAHFGKATGNGTLTAITNPGGPGTTMSIDNKLALSVQGGGTYAFTPKVYLEASLTHTWLTAHTTLSTGQTIDAKLNPLTIGLFVGYRY